MLVAETETFEQQVAEQGRPVVVYFWTKWCQACKLMAPHIEQLAQENKDKYEVVKVDIGANPQVAERYNVLGTPTVLLFRPGKDRPAELQTGFAAKAYLAELINKYI